MRSSLVAVAALAATAAAFLAPAPARGLRGPRGAPRAASDDEELRRLRAEIEELESEVAADKARLAAARPEPAAPPPRARPRGGGAAIRDGKVRVEAVLERLDAGLLPDGADEANEKRTFAAACALDAMEGEGLKHQDIGPAQMVTLDANEELQLLLEGLDPTTIDDDDFAQFRTLTDTVITWLAERDFAEDQATDDDWQDLAARLETEDAGDEDVSFEEELTDGRVFGIQLEPAMTPQVLSFKIDDRFKASLDEHWADWCAVLGEKAAMGGTAPPAEDLACFGAAIEAAAPDATSHQFSAASRTNVSEARVAFGNGFDGGLVGMLADGSDPTSLFEKHFRRELARVSEKKSGERTPEDLDALWTAARVATLRADRQTSQIEALAGYFFDQVSVADSREVVLAKLREFDLVPADETDPVRLRDAFLVKVVEYTGFLGNLIVGFVLTLQVLVTYLFLQFVGFPLVDWAFGLGQPAGDIPDFFEQARPWWDVFSR